MNSASMKMVKMDILAILAWMTTALAAEINNVSPGTNASAASGISARLLQPDLIAISDIASLTRESAESEKPIIRVRGIVLDQGIGEYVILQDDTGTVRAETRQTTPLGGGEYVTAWGRLSWDGNRVFLQGASFRPLAWDSIAEEKIVPAPGKPEQLPLLNQIRQVHELPPSQAAWKYPVRVRAVITGIRDYGSSRALLVQDETGGVFVRVSRTNFTQNPAAGDDVEIEGLSGPGGYAPIIESATIRIVGKRNLPEPRLVTLYQIASGQLDALWVEVRGVVRSVQHNPRYANIEISDINGLVEVDVADLGLSTNLVDSLVSVRGVCISRPNEKRQLVSSYVWVPSTNFIVIEESGATDPFSIPLQRIGSLGEFGQRHTLQHRVRVAGVVTFSEPGRPLFIQDETGGLPVFLAQAEDFKPGDQVEAVGYVSPGNNFGYVIRNAVCREIGRGSLPEPRVVAHVGALSQNLHGFWVQLDARLVSISHRGAEDLLTLQADGSVFDAFRLTRSDTPRDRPPRIGSLVRLRGVYSIIGNEARSPRTFCIYVPQAEPIEIVEKASWWTAGRTSAVVGFMGVTGLGAALWAIMLRRRVHEQTIVIRERFEKEASLQQRYREIFESASDLIFTHDLEGNVTSLNPACQRVLGYNNGGIKNLTINHVLAPASLRAVQEWGSATLNDRTVATCELELIGRDGRRVLVEASPRAVFKGEKPVGFQAIARDITERKQVEAALRQSEQKFRSLVEQSLVGVYIIQEGRFVYANPRLAEIFGYTPEELLALRSIQNLVFRDDRTIVQEQIHRRIDSQTITAHYRFRGMRKDGSMIHLEVLGSRTEYRDQPAVLGTLMDITERTRAEEELFNSRQMLRMVLDTIPQRVCWKDRNSVYLGCNKALAQDCGYSDPNELIGKSDFETASAQFAEHYQEDDRKVLETASPLYNFEEKQIRADGTQRWLNTSKVPLFDKERNVTGVLVTYEDITTRKEAEAALAEASSLLQTLLENIPDVIYFKERNSRFVHYSKSMMNLFHISDSNAVKGKTDFDFFLEEHARAAFEDEQKIVRTGQPLIGKPEKETHLDGRVTWALTTKMPWRDRNGNIIGTFGTSKDVTAIKEAEEKLAYEQELFQTLLDHFPDYIYFKDCESRFVRVSKSKAERTLPFARAQYLASHPSANPDGLPEHLTGTETFMKYLIGKTDFDTFDEQFARKAFEDEQEIMRTGKPIIAVLEQIANPEGGYLWMLVTKLPWHDRDGNVIGTFGISRDITALKEAEARLEAAHQRVIETSRLAGMAEVATDVLHNVGNVLNSLNISCSLSIDMVKSSKVASIFRLSTLLQDNQNRLADFFATDPRARQLPEYLAALAQHLTGEQESLVRELEQLVKHIDHIKQIVSMQQSYAKVAGVLEEVNPAQLVEDALQINAAALSRHDVQLRRDFEETPTITTEKHKVLQILVNLIRNSKYAMDDAKRPDKILRIHVGSDGADTVRIEVIDNGVGIAKENLTRIFSHGFTTRRNGHGFGLHSSALAVRDLGGSISAYSNGPGTGATFTLLLPMNPPTTPS